MHSGLPTPWTGVGQVQSLHGAANIRDAGDRRIDLIDVRKHLQVMAIAACEQVGVQGIRVPKPPAQHHGIWQLSAKQSEQPLVLYKSVFFAPLGTE